MSRRAFLAGLLGCSVLNAFPSPVQAYFAEHWHERSKPLMGTYVSIAVRHADRALALALIGDCFRYMESLITILSSWDPLSKVSQLSVERRADNAPDCVMRMLTTAAWAGRLSEGRFDIFIGQLTELWREARIAVAQPSRSDIRSATQRTVGSAATLRGETVSLTGTGVIDVGGIGKGVIADAACEYLAARGICTGRVACSGDLRFLGDGPWTVEVENPDGPKSRVLTLCGPVAVSTSGISESFWSGRGARDYHHLIDPVSGEPGRENRQVTVIAPTAAQSDALSSGLFFIPARCHSAILRETRSCSALTVDAHGMIHSS